MLGPTIEELAEEYKGRVAVGKINVDEEENLAREFSISSIPNVIIFKNGKVVDKLLGFRPKESYKHILDNLL